MTTLADVAAAAGVSTTTVSHVINGTRHVNTETIERVREAIRDTGYRPNPYARALRTATTETVGFVASDIANPFTTAVMRGITTELRKANRTLLVSTSDEDSTLELEEIDALVQRRVDGLIVALTTESDWQTIEYLDALPIPVVLIDRAVDNSLDQVLVENFHSVKEVVAELLELGHRRIAMVAGRAHHSTTIERTAGWRAAYADADVPIDERLLLNVDRGAHEACLAVGTLLDSNRPPTAVFAASNTLTLGSLRAFKARRLSVPDDVSLAAFDDLDYADLLQFPVSALAQPETEIGSEAVRLLLRRMHDSDAQAVQVRLDPVLHRRGSWRRLDES